MPARKDGGGSGWSRARGASTLDIVTTVRLTLEIERGVEPISGRLTGPHDQQREFCGWTALAATIDSAIYTDSSPSKGPREERNE